MVLGENLLSQRKKPLPLKVVKNDKKESEYKNYHIKLTPEGGKFYYQYAMDSGAKLG